MCSSDLGIIYTMTDDNGKPICTPIKSSLIGKRFGYEGVEIGLPLSSVIV